MEDGQLGSMIRVGIIGINEGNGHPYSFSCIINGYDDDSLKASGWDVIYNYIRAQDSSDVNFDEIEVTHVWTQNILESNKIAKAAKIPNVVENYLDMLGKIDALIIARDDFEKHLEMAKPFLESNCYVFIDKPLALEVEELKYFKTYLKNGKLMSCSGMRYCTELDSLRVNLDNYGEIKLLRGTVINGMEKYGVHMLEAFFSFLPFEVKRVEAIDSTIDSLILHNENGSIFQIDALGKTVKTFQVDLFATDGRFNTELNNNFVAFRRTLFHFFKAVRERRPLPSLPTIEIMKILIAYNMSKTENRVVDLSEIDL